MEFKRIGSQGLKVHLTQSDMDRLHITYDSVDYADVRTRQAVNRLLELAKNSTGFELPAAKLLIEVYPGQDGGCTFYFSPLDDGIHGLLSPQGDARRPIILELPTFHRVLETAFRVTRQFLSATRRSALYTNQNQYRLLLWPLPQQKAPLEQFCQEYGTLIPGKWACAFTQEHWAPLLALLRRSATAFP